MTVKVVILRSAQEDLLDLKSDHIKKFDRAAWQDSYAGIEQAVARIEAYSAAGRNRMSWHHST